MSTKTLTQEELKNVIAYADSLQQYDRRRQDQKLLEGIVKREEQATQKVEGISLAIVYEIGKELDISREYMKRALEALYPDRDQKAKDLELVKGKLSPEVVHHSIHDRYKQRCLAALQRAVPAQKCTVDEDLPSGKYWGGLPSEITFYQQQLKTKTFFRWTYQARKEVSLATLIFSPENSNYKVDAHLYHPLFLRAASIELTALQEECQSLYKVTISTDIVSHYDPHE